VWSDSRDVDCNVYAARVTGAGTVLDTAGIEVCSAPGAQGCPAVEYDGTNFLVVWQDQRDGERDLYGARVTREGTVLDTFAVITQPGYQVDPVLARDGGSRMVLAYSGWTSVEQERPYNSPRIWATLSPHAGASDRLADRLRPASPFPTVVRDVLFLPAASNPEGPRWMLDAAGRKAVELRPGANDLRTLAPGVYFIQPGAGAKRGGSGVTKVVVTG
jgi:hypothetical protein